MKAIVTVAAVAALLLAGCQPKADTADHLGRARDLVSRNDVDGAIAEAAKAIKANPRNKDAYFLTGELQERKGAMQAAFEAYARADMVDATDHRARLKTITMLIGANELEAAASRINATLGDDPANVEALADRALVFLKQGDTVKARRDALRVVSLQTGNTTAAAVLGSLAMGEKNADLAVQIIERGLSTDPADATLLQLKADAFLLQKAPDKAIEIERQLVAAQPKAPGPRVALAELEATAHGVDAGERVLRDGVAAAPSDRTLGLQLATFLLRHDRPDAADAVLGDAIAADPQGSAYDLARADILIRRGRADEAVAGLRTAVQRLTDGPARNAARLGLARLLVARNDREGARALIEDALKTEPNNDLALIMRADIAPPDASAQALADLLAVTGRQPNNPAPFASLAALYLRLDKKAEALAALTRIADLAPHDLAASLRVVDMATSLDRPDDAKGALDAFVMRNPDVVAGHVAQTRLAIIRRDWFAADRDVDALRPLPGGADVARQLTAAIKEGRGQWAEAAALYKAQIQTASTRFDSGAAAAYIRTAVQAKQGDDALAFLNGLAGGLPAGDVPTLKLAIGSLQQALGQGEAAIAANQAAIQAAPKEASAYAQQVAALMKFKQFDRAAAVIDAGLQAGAPREQLLFARAILEGSTSKVDEAVATYREILATQPDAAVAANNMASLLADRKPLDAAALKAARDRLKPFAVSGSPIILDTLGWAAYRLGELEEAKALLQHAKADASPLPDLRFHYGAVLMDSGEKEAGRTLLKTVLGQDFAGQTEAARLALE